MTRKTYGQYCGLAKALDHVGDRWTLLIVRELLMGPRRYSRIRAGLPGIATNLLADRLRELEADGIIRQGDAGYELTEFGRGLEKVVHELVRWGGHWMRHREPEEEFRPEWFAIALAALVPRRRAGKVEIRTGDGVVSIDRGRVLVGSSDDPDAIVEGETQLVLGVAAGELPLASLDVTGDATVAAGALGAGP